MPESRMNEVALELWQRTKAGKVEWERTRSGDAYRVVFPDVLLTISRHSTRVLPVTHVPDPLYHYAYQLDLHDDTGKVIGSLAPVQEDSVHQLLAELFTLAEQYVQRNVQESGIDKALDYLKRS